MQSGNPKKKREGVSDNQMDWFQGAGDQGVTIGYACDETPQLMPMPVVLANRIVRELSACRRSSYIEGICPDGKAQVTVEYEDGKPVRLDSVVVSCQHIRPQENGSHYDCEYVELNNSRYGIVVSAENAFSFNASYYTQEELEKKTHNYELTESDSLVFCVDYALNGIGSNSCGPVVLEQYRFDDVLFRFQFTLIPYVKG